MQGVNAGRLAEPLLQVRTIPRDAAQCPVRIWCIFRCMQEHKACTTTVSRWTPALFPEPLSHHGASVRAVQGQGGLGQLPISQLQSQRCFSTMTPLPSTRTCSARPLYEGMRLPPAVASHRPASRERLLTECVHGRWQHTPQQHRSRHRQPHGARRPVPGAHWAPRTVHREAIEEPIKILVKVRGEPVKIRLEQALRAALAPLCARRPYTAQQSHALPLNSPLSRVMTEERPQRSYCRPASAGIALPSGGLPLPCRVPERC